MFDIGFTEILLIAVVGLVVIGPKRLPETIRFLGYWVGKLRRSVHGAREEMEREFGLDEIRRELYNEELLGRLDDERKQIERRLNSPSEPRDEPTPANLKIPNEEDFIDDGPSEPLLQNEESDEPDASASAQAAPNSDSPSATESAPETTANKNP
ncbi:MAG: twin-arginine translocase subunit TatB [Gammaproteobacteria bacterium]|nr:twin-arginine translocase subunit TatB [Gammaproteobacteria bacterium]MBQ0840508.1 twin-arginine translocase subunit TatB [Gammaproteobacteria bacterium]